MYTKYQLEVCFQEGAQASGSEAQNITHIKISSILYKSIKKKLLQLHKLSIPSLNLWKTPKVWQNCNK